MTAAPRRRSVDAFPRRMSQVEPDLPTEPIPLTVYGIHEPTPGPRWQALFAATWPAYRQLVPAARRPRPAGSCSSRSACSPRTCPNWCRPTSGWSSWPQEVGADEVAARMLTLWDPPRFLPGCSQAVLTEPEIALCRNYDYSPDLWERVVYSSAIPRSPGDRQQRLPVGAAGRDERRRPGGVAELRRPARVRTGFRGVAGRPLPAGGGIHGRARPGRSWSGMPVAMTYNLTMVDATGTVRDRLCRAGPDAGVQHSPIATNHRGELPDDDDHAHRYASVQRRTHLLDGGRRRPDPRATRRAVPAAAAAFHRTTGGRSAPSTPRSTGRPTACWSCVGRIGAGNGDSMIRTTRSTSCCDPVERPRRLSRHRRSRSAAAPATARCGFPANPGSGPECPRQCSSCSGACAGGCPDSAAAGSHCPWCASQTRSEASRSPRPVRSCSIKPASSDSANARPAAGSMRPVTPCAEMSRKLVTWPPVRRANLAAWRAWRCAGASPE